MAVFIRLATVAAALLLGGCFKSVVTYTRFTVAVYDQSTPDEGFARSRDIDAYAYYVDTTEWRVASYEDAAEGRITNKLTGEMLDAPDVRGAFNSSQEYQVSLVLTGEVSMIVVVNPEQKLYAYRRYELPVNLPQVDTKLYMAAWRPTHTSSGWVVVNRFYSPEEPDTPDDTDEDDGGTEDTDEGDEGGGADAEDGDGDGGNTGEAGTDTDAGTDPGAEEDAGTDAEDTEDGARG